MAKAPHFIIHAAKDNVGVVVVEDIKEGQALDGWVMDTDASLSLTAGADIPLGHKIAVQDLAAGTAAIKYGEDIGKMTAAVTQGGYVHTHNLKTKRW